MMKYLCLVYYDEKEIQQLFQQEWDRLNRDCMDCVDDFTQGGHLLDGEPLLSKDAATTLSVSDQKALITDHPFAETKEQLATLYMLEVRDINEVIRLAEKIQTERYGCVEIRPVRELMEQGNSR